MSKIKESIPDRRKSALRRTKKAGGAYKHHKRTTPEPLIAPESLGERTENALIRLDRAGIRPYKSAENTTRRKVIATVIGALALVAGTVTLGRFAPDGGEPPSPANMTEFSDDPLQAQYNVNPESLMIVGGEIQQLPVPSERLGRD